MYKRKFYFAKFPAANQTKPIEVSIWLIRLNSTKI